MRNNNQHSKTRVTASKHRHNSSDTLKRVASVVAPVILLGAGAVAMLTYTGEETPDAFGCYARPDQHKTAVFIDNSLRQLSKAQLRDYSTALTRAYEMAPANARISIFTTASDRNGSLANPVFTMCKPASTPMEQATIGAPEKPAPYLIREAKKAATRYHEAVKSELLTVQDKTKLASDSPILEQLRAISMSADFTSQNRSLWVISDGISNSETARFCVVKGALPSFTTFMQRADYVDYIQPRSFAGTNVTLLLVEHGPLPTKGLPFCSTREIRDFWVHYFKKNHADSVELTPLRHWMGSK